MSQFFRFLVLVGLPAVLLFPGRSPGQTPAFVGGASSLPREPQAVHLLHSAQDALREQGWQHALGALQQLLVRPDCLIEIEERKGDRTVIRLAGVHSEAFRLLRTLPEEGQSFREVYWGPVAQERLDQARKAHDSAGLLAVARDFPTSRASLQALEESARLEDQAGSSGAAIRALHLLKRLEPESAWPAERRQLAAQVLARAASRGASSSHFWPLVGGNAARSAHADLSLRTGWNNKSGRSEEPGAVTIEPVWSKPLGIVARSIRWVRDAGAVLDKQGQPTPGASSPIVVSNPLPGQPPLVVFRTRLGLQVVKSKGGDLVWRTASLWSLDGMIGKPEKADAVEAWVSDYLEMLGRPSVLFENSTVGTLSADSTQIYAIEDLAVVPTIEMAGRFPQGEEAGPEQRPIDAVQHNRLQAYDLASGKRRWEVGGRGPEAGDLANTFFLGPPLPVEDRLFVLNEKDRELRLLGLSPIDGRLLSVQPLMRTGKPLLAEPGRRMTAAHLALAEGILVCPTNAGAVLAVDLLTGSLLWAHLYQDARLKPATTSVWQSGPPCIVDGKVIVAPPDAAVIDCLDLRDGSRLWRVQRAEDDVLLAGVADGKVLLVGKKSCRALGLNRGETLWTVPTGVPSGQAAIAGGRLFVPLKAGSASGRPEVCVVELARGKMETRLRSRKEQAPGTLVFGPGIVLSLTPTELTAYPIPKD
jgi:outer membrane protein assembly factor BamB